MLVRDDANPRSLAFQAKGLAEYIAKLEASHGPFAGDVLAPAHAALRALQPADLRSRERAADADPGAAAARRLRGRPTTISLKFFSHAVTRSVLSLVA